MKLRNLAIASAMLLTGAAHAQSSVTLYGTIDTSMVYVNNAKTSTGQGASQFLLTSGSLSTSRWGLRGNEDLGGGLHAVFDLESGFAVNNGALKNSTAAQTDLFGRQAWVGLSSDQYGALTLGRQYDFIVDYVAPNSGTGSGFGGNLASHPYDNDNLDNDLRLNNSVKFSSVSYGGFKAGAMYAFSNMAGAGGNNNAYSLGASYSNGPINIGAAYLQLNRDAALPNAAGASSINDGDQLAGGGDQQIWGASAQYRFGEKSAVGLVYTHSVTYNINSLFGATNTISGQSMKFDNFEINGRYFVRPDFSLGASYTYTMGAFSGGSTGPAADPHWNNFVVQADYQFSARTEVYAQAVYQLVGGGNGNSIFNAGVYGMTQSSTNKQLVTAIGLRHRF
ncbi:porin [Paraburkholderia sp. RL18-103-BIB-C]|jgi:predicted porin|uniref:porin n=1 Tax=unclassified Paraburkholderia TaxID=2615204 RepID=UPI0038BD2BC4